MSLTPEQIEMRRTGIGSSEIGVLAGFSQWSSPIAIYDEKVLGASKEATLAMKLGTLIEEPIAQLYAEEKGYTFLSVLPTIRSKEHAFALATPDRAVHIGDVWRGVPSPTGPVSLDTALKSIDTMGDQFWATVERLLEVKHASWRTKKEWTDPVIDPTGVAREYQAQVQWEMGVTGRRLIDVAVLFDKDTLWIYSLEFDRAFFEALLVIAERFMVDHVWAKKPPPPDASDKYAEHLARVYPHEKTTDLAPSTDELLALVATLRADELAKKALEESIKLNQQVLKDAIGEHVGMLTQFGTVTWKAVAGRTKTDFEKIARALLAHLPANEAGEIWKHLVTENTRFANGHRRLLKPWSREQPE